MKKSALILFLLLGLVSPAQARDFGVIVGVHDYSDPKLNLVGPFHDAQLVLKTWTNLGMPADNIEVLTGETANLMEFDLALQKLSDDMHASDTLYIYWSSHGGGNFLSTTDGRMPAQTLYNLLKNVPARNINIFVDACHMDAFTFPKIKCKNVKLLYMLGKNNLASETWIPEDLRPGFDPSMYQPSMPPVVNGIATFAYAHAFDSNPMDLSVAVESMNHNQEVLKRLIQGNLTAHLKDFSGQGAEGQDWMAHLKHGTLTITSDTMAHLNSEGGVQRHTQGTSSYQFSFTLKRVIRVAEAYQDSFQYEAMVDEMNYQLNLADFFIVPGPYGSRGDYAASANGLLPYRAQPPEFVLEIQPKVDVWTLSFRSPSFPVQYRSSESRGGQSQTEMTQDISLYYADAINCEKKTIDGSYTFDVSKPYAKNNLDSQAAAARRTAANPNPYQGLSQSEMLKRFWEDTRKRWETVMLPYPVPPGIPIAAAYFDIYLGYAMGKPSPGSTSSGTIKMKWDFQ